MVASSSSTEELEQMAVIDWSLHFSSLRWLHAIPNGGHRHKKTAGRLKASGVKAGVLDLFLPVWVPPYHGLYIEMKYGRNKMTEKQQEFADFAIENSFKVVTCWSADEAINEIKTYMGERL